MTSVSRRETESTEVAAKTEFSEIQYAQCWEDADVLLEGLDVQPGDTCLSVASAGDNSLSLLVNNPARVIAVDLSPAQLACLELRVAAYRTLEHQELLELMGSLSSGRRQALYLRCRPQLQTEQVRDFWDRHLHQLTIFGLGGVGRFERYFHLFRRFVLPLMHSRSHVFRLLAEKSPAEREQFYDACWNNWRWRLLFRVFFSRTVMKSFGREPAYFLYAKGSVAEHVLRRARYAMTELDPAANPYMTWILTGHHGNALPHALRKENLPSIRDNLDRIEWHLCSVEAFADEACRRGLKIQRFNLSDVFEYMSEQNYEDALRRLLAVAAPSARLLYWNMMVPRSRPRVLSGRLEPLKDFARRLHDRDKAFFYSRLNIEEVQ